MNMFRSESPTGRDLLILVDHQQAGYMGMVEGQVDLHLPSSQLGRMEIAGIFPGIYHRKWPWAMPWAMPCHAMVSVYVSVVYGCYSGTFSESEGENDRT